MTDEEIFDLVKRNYHEANKEYIKEQIRIATEQINKNDKELIRMAREGDAQ